MKGLGITFVIFGILNLIVGISAAAYGEAEAAGRKFGDAEMCTLVEEYAKEYAKEYAEEAVAETATAAVDRMITELNMDLPEACRIQGITVEKYQEYKKKSNQ